MFRFLSLEHCARITTWNEVRRTRQKASKIASRARLVLFLAFNVAVWTLFIAPMLRH